MSKLSVKDLKGAKLEALKSIHEGFGFASPRPSCECECKGCIEGTKCMCADEGCCQCRE